MGWLIEVARFDFFHDDYLQIFRYCECFASGIYCNGCNCVDCHNNIENKPARIAAVESILERNRNVFSSKTANSPHLTPDIKHMAENPIIFCSNMGFVSLELVLVRFKVQNKDTTSVAKQQKGCHCKKTFCLKKYCQCFQAEILCSEHCKCLDCKNLKGCAERLVLSPQERYNAKTCFRRASATPTAAIQRSDSLVSIRKGGQEPLGFNEKNTPIQVPFSSKCYNVIAFGRRKHFYHSTSYYLHSKSNGLTKITWIL
ncbi:protein tesmin/TSO1-like CXC 6 [Humulus lupulus]|uniref:protein tesmin/TSO1-like CXC 6 n=1 Tax=Humulus lupulus TaxID=3486 RepID=UPI002B40D138|nr:protein tesmin/TSO1-like CXC 6 [Humulus lupulus]